MRYLKNSHCLFLLLLMLTLVLSCQKEKSTVDLVIENATIWTGNEKQNTAQSMAIVGDSIIAIGTNEEIQQFKDKAKEVIDMKGAFITPGFIDAHVHLMMGGNSLLSVELRDANTQKEFIRRIAEYAKTLEPGSWILEGNWDHTLWGGELPRKEWIDEYTEEKPVVLYRLDGHMVLANSLALKIAGIDKNTPDIVGGEIVRDKDGVPTGILKDNAMNILLNKIPPMSETQKENALKAAMKYLLSNGVTSVHDVDSIGTYSAAKKLRKANELSVRIYVASPLSKWNHVVSMGDKNNDKWLKTGSVKGFVDGSLGSHTAAFNQPYIDKPDDKGIFINSEKNLYKWISGADKANLQVIVHAIGDRAIHSLLDIYERVIKENGIKERRFRIEHVQHILKEDIKRFAKLGIIASMQPYHAIDDGRWAEELIGPERIKTTYAFKSMMDSKAIVAFGSDWPVAPASPLLGIYAAVTRRTLDDKNPNGWVPEQKITVEQALTAFTKNAAYAAFDDKVKGTLEPGKLADFVVISEDVRKVDLVKIKELKVLQTYVAGKKVYDSKDEK